MEFPRKRGQKGVALFVPCLLKSVVQLKIFEEIEGFEDKNRFIFSVMMALYGTISHNWVNLSTISLME